MKLSIIVPVYNEEHTIANVLSRLSNLQLINNIEKEIVVVNDCSNDNTENIVLKFVDSNKNINIVYSKHEKNKGKGRGVKTGINISSGDLIAIQDADLEYDPNDLNSIVKKFQDDSVMVVYGSRTLKERKLKRSKIFKGKHPNAHILAYVGNIIITGLINLIHSTNYTDIFTCYKCFSSKLIKTYQIDNDDFAWEPELTIKLIQNKIDIHEVPISYYPRQSKEGKKVNALDGIKAIVAILKYSFAKPQTEKYNDKNPTAKRKKIVSSIII